MPSYAWAYRVGFRPWERYVSTAAPSIAAMLDREEADRRQPLGRALDLGCGRGLYSRLLAEREWEVVGIDQVPAAIEAAQPADAGPGPTYVVGDVTDLPPDLGPFDLFLDVGCFQGLDAGQRLAYGRGVTRLANPGATVLQLSFGASRWRSLVGGVSQAEVQEAFPGWELLSVDAADTAGLGWPMNRTAPQWFRLRHESPAAS